ncbi:40S ribosomal protein S15-like isoform X2 [Ananas comosus]|uniref:40S ribosomal protein S15-like isoform X2 n=1 Tax=Ananas comosus TaxID=4615 RepID=A0A6P5F3A0_ANACO|nr:40S ribosomal protein S15-like isoform X2 [Ananas comosus]
MARASPLKSEKRREREEKSVPQPHSHSLSLCPPPLIRRIAANPNPSSSSSSSSSSRRRANSGSVAMAEASDAVGVGGSQPKKRTFMKFSFRGVDLDQLLAMATDELRKKQDAPPGEKPGPVRTHLRNMIIVPEMIASIIDVYNGKTFNQLEIKPEMIGHCLAEFSITYKPLKHGRPGIGATHSSRFIPLK